MPLLSNNLRLGAHSESASKTMKTRARVSSGLRSGLCAKAYNPAKAASEMEVAL